MYIRRKVFSLLRDENGDERYFSTTEYTMISDGEETRYFAKTDEDEDEKKAKRKKIAKKVAIGAGIAAGSALAATGLYQLGRKGQIKYDDKMALKANNGDGSSRAFRAAARKSDRKELGLDKLGHKIEGNATKASEDVIEATKKGFKTAKETTVKGAKKAGETLKKGAEVVEETATKVGKTVKETGKKAIEGAKKTGKDLVEGTKKAVKKVTKKDKE